MIKKFFMYLIPGLTIGLTLGVLARPKTNLDRLFRFYCTDNTGQAVASLQEYGTVSFLKSTKLKDGGNIAYVYRSPGGQVFIFDHPLRDAHGLFSDQFTYTPSNFDREFEKPFQLWVSGRVIEVDPSKVPTPAASPAPTQRVPGPAQNPSGKK